MRFGDVNDLLFISPEEVFEHTKPQIKMVNNIDKLYPKRHPLISESILKYTKASSINERLNLEYYDTTMQQEKLQNLTNEDMDLSNNLDLAMANMPPLETDIILFRGTRFPMKTVVPGYSSTSADINVALRFTNADGEHKYDKETGRYIGESCCLNVIHVKKGSYVLPITAELSAFNNNYGFYKFEAEYLLPRYSDFVYLGTDLVKYRPVPDEFIRFGKALMDSSDFTRTDDLRDDPDNYPVIKFMHYSFDGSMMEI